MRFTREDAKRLINELPRTYIEMSDKDYEWVYGNLPGKTATRPLQIAELVIAFVNNGGKSVPEFTYLWNKAIQLEVVNVKDTQKLIERSYKYVKTRNKGDAIESLYKYVNQELKLRTTVELRPIIKGILEVNRTFNELIDLFAPAEVEGASKEVCSKMKELVERTSNKTLTLEFEMSVGGFLVAKIKPHPSSNPEVYQLFKMIQNQDYNMLLSMIPESQFDALYGAVYSGNESQIIKYLKGLGVKELLEVKKAIDVINELLNETYAKYKKPIDSAYTKALKLV